MKVCRSRTTCSSTLAARCAIGLLAAGVVALNCTISLAALAGRTCRAAAIGWLSATDAIMRCMLN
jgi:hypothetical protein